MTFLEELKQLMAEYNMTPNEVSDAVDVPRPTVRRWLEGRSEPHPAVRSSVVEMIHTAGKNKSV